MDIHSFESLKKKQEELQLAKAREEAKLDSLNKELEQCASKLKELGIDDFSNLDALLAEKEKELQSQYDTLMSMISELQS